jgi:Fe-S cluster assembly protein SufD
MNVSGVAPLLQSWSEEFESRQDRTQPPWVHQLREQAAAQFNAAGLPTRKTEAWKYTPLRLLEKNAPAIVVSPRAASDESAFPAPLDKPGAAVVNIRNGSLSGNLPKLPEGITLLALHEGLEAFGDKLRPLLSAVPLDGAGRAFSALNTAFLDQGLLVHVEEGVKAGPFLLRWAMSREEKPEMGHFRVLILLESGAELELLEQFESTGETENALNVVMQAELGKGASLGHVRLQLETDGVVLLTSTSITQDAGSEYVYSGFDLGGGLVRHEFDATLGGAGAKAGFNGAFVLDGKRHVDNHVSVDHASPGCSSTQFFRGVLGGSSRGVFNGRALIRPGADESRVQQSNANLLLSPLAEMDTKPELEIYADEVEASHGATVGQLDEAAVFYLRTRGLSDAQARRMLTSAFCRAVSDRLEDRELAASIAEMLDAAMPGGPPATGVAA